MNRMLALAALLAAGCSGVKEDRSGCARSADCPAGETCAATPDGAVCWPDAQPPAVSGVAVTCGPPCLRDGTLRVEATVADDHEVGEVTVALDLDPSRAVPMTRAGARWVAQVPLEEFPFPAFERAVVATVTARDGARNASVPVDAAAQTVTRLRWAQAADSGATVALSSPAVDGSGTVVLGASNGMVYRFDGAGLPVGEPVQLAGGSAGVPSVEGSATWIGTQGGSLYVLDVGVSPADCSPGEPIAGPPTLVGARAVAGSQAGVVIVADTSGFCNQTSALGPVAAPVVVTAAGSVIAASSGTLLKFGLPASGVLRSEWTGIDSPLPPRVGDAVVQPLAVDETDALWTVAQNGALNRTAADATTTTIATVPVGSSGPIVLADGSVVVGSGAGMLQRFSTASAPPWAESEPLNGVPAVPLALAGTRPALLVPTSTGRLYAVNADDGKIAWSVKLSATGQALQPANIHGAPGAATSTAYVAGADGKLYAVIVDGQLDRAAPWPKAFHDPRNTGNAGALP
ncbi:Pyrrolo-quinoline quinone [Anaeromyxobacter dehalogenans 2CP-1]|uniref:Pyrrolo-quinoline quinone n=1 Tax=Anaeromyxobacter dehalogenans (strain ATCC BAA-258 / DSM 21875 / 2CP-1) TaxID=455488 RepID=B8JBS4_ANAD2|nr:PQQ-binding-like beta-propeller repeat protein [Anaeromyxobacter dehalogenans]ACL67682.1 Pyrrolo-quinoline quinone [Anaeromyxobacter dehalogenans 2CP-1]